VFCLCNFCDKFLFDRFFVSFILEFSTDLLFSFSTALFSFFVCLCFQ